MRKALIPLAIILGGMGAVVVLAIGLVLGFLVGGNFERSRRFEHESKVISDTIKSQGFPRLECLPYGGDGTAMLSGNVPSKAEYDKLYFLVEKTFGTLGLDDRMAGVKIDDPSPALDPRGSTTRP